MIRATITGVDNIQAAFLSMAVKMPTVATSAAKAGAELVAGIAKREGFRTRGEETGTRVSKSGKTVKTYAALGAPLADKLTSRTGYLRSSITVKVAGVGVAVTGPTAVYGGIHEFGGTISIGGRSWRGGFQKSSKRAKARTILARYVKRHTVGAYAVRMPARPYMRPAWEGHKAEVRATVVREIKRALALT